MRALAFALVGIAIVMALVGQWIGDAVNAAVAATVFGF